MAPGGPGGIARPYPWRAPEKRLTVDGGQNRVPRVTMYHQRAAGQCERHLADDETAPAILKVDVAGQTVTTGTARKSALKSVTHLDGQLILQGGENGRGWSATIDEETGRMAVAIVDHDYTFSLFGVCTLP
jgi:hypothetical protein